MSKNPEMEVTQFEISGPLLIKPRVFYDERGYFFESYNENVFHKNGITSHFVQDNQSSSVKNVLRGLHFQHPPFDQGKLVRVLSGSVLDIAVDIRKNSPTYGQHLKVELSAENQFLFWIPPGFAHGFISLEENTIFLYKCTNLYDKNSESGILWNDPELNIDWGISQPIVSDKDRELPLFNQIESRFEFKI
jgi:dTDP-4-dehydrorhamnose 3,5-epimerase